MNKTTFIYGLVDPITLEVRYIGKADDPYKRFQRHINRNYHCHCAYWIQSLIKQGLKPVWVVLEQCDQSIWIDRETNWIAFGRKIGWRLTNETEGGEGLSSPSKSTREKLSKIAKERIVSLETRKRQSDAHKGKTTWIKGKHHSEETKRKISEKSKIQIRNPSKETIEKIRQSNLNNHRHCSEKTKEKISSANKGHHHTEETKIKISETMRKVLAK